MNFDEFLTPENTSPATEPAELDIQKAVVESLAADKAEQDEVLRDLRMQLAVRDGQVKSQEAMMKSLHEKISELNATVASLKSRVAEEQRKLAAEKEREFDRQERNPNALALLDRDVELPDRFPGETRDHVLEVLAEARTRAEADGRIRLAQVLEGVLVANEPNGTLARRRAELSRLFSDNGNIVSGPVLSQLERLGIPHKNGESYLLPSEIIKRTY